MFRGLQRSLCVPRFAAFLVCSEVCSVPRFAAFRGLQRSEVCSVPRFAGFLVCSEICSVPNVFRGLQRSEVCRVPCVRFDFDSVPCVLSSRAVLRSADHRPGVNHVPQGRRQLPGDSATYDQGNELLPMLKTLLAFCFYHTFILIAFTDARGYI